jgi:hypothetical protein
MAEQLRLVVSPDGRLHEAAEPARPVARAPQTAPAPEPDPEVVAANRARIEALKHLPYGHAPPSPPPARPPVTAAPERRGRFRRRARYDAFGRELHPRGARRDPFGRVNPSWPHGYR